MMDQILTFNEKTGPTGYKTVLQNQQHDEVIEKSVDCVTLKTFAMTEWKNNVQLLNLMPGIFIFLGIKIYQYIADR